MEDTNNIISLYLAAQKLLDSKAYQDAFLQYVNCMRKLLDSLVITNSSDSICDKTEALMDIFRIFKSCLLQCETLALTPPRTTSLLQAESSETVNPMSEDNLAAECVSMPALVVSKSTSLNSMTAEISLPPLRNQTSLTDLKRIRQRNVRLNRTAKSIDSSASQLSKGSDDFSNLFDKQRESAIRLYHNLMDSPMILVQTRPAEKGKQNQMKSHQRFPLVPTSPVLVENKNLIDMMHTVKAKLDSAEIRNNHHVANPQEIHVIRQLNNQMNELRHRNKELSSQLHYAKSNNLDICSFHSDRIAFTITLIDWLIFTKIEPNELLLHNPPLKPANSVQVSTDFFNYLTRVIETMIFSYQDPTVQGQILQRWLKIAQRLFDLRNFNSLKAIMSVLDNSFIQKSVKAWESISKKAVNSFETLRDLMSEQNNYEKYRDLLELRKKPCIPFLGVFIHDITYLQAAKLHGEDCFRSKIDAKIREITQFMKELQTSDYLSESKFYECKSKHHLASGFRRDKKECITEKFGYACDSNFCAHFLLTQIYVDDAELDRLRQTYGRSTSPYRAQSPSKINQMMNQVLGDSWRSRSKTLLTPPAKTSTSGKEPSSHTRNRVRSKTDSLLEFEHLQ